jgi:hypothetical protein
MHFNLIMDFRNFYENALKISLISCLEYVLTVRSILLWAEDSHVSGEQEAVTCCIPLALM